MYRLQRCTEIQSLYQINQLSGETTVIIFSGYLLNLFFSPKYPPKLSPFKWLNGLGPTSELTEWEKKMNICRLHNYCQCFFTFLLVQLSICLFSSTALLSGQEALLGDGDLLCWSASPDTTLWTSFSSPAAELQTTPHRREECHFSAQCFFINDF